MATTQKDYPIFKKGNLLYEREEKEGYWTVTPKLHPETRELVINFTARKILELCNGKRTIEEIVDEMKNNFPTVSKKEIQKDVYDAIGRFSRLLVIEWMGENPFLYKRETILSDDLALMIAQEDDILRIKKFIDDSNIFQNNRQIEDKSNFFFYKNPFDSPLEYEEVSLRAKLFSFIEDFFLLIKGKEIAGLMSISPPIVSPATAAIIKIIAAPKDFWGDLNRYAYDSLPFVSIRKVTKIKILENTSERINPELEKVLLNEGYKEEGIMEHELGFSNHLRSLAKYYSEAFIEKVEHQRVWKIEG
ncbi:MAG: PqqD family peptide modification chaperone [bacterium]|nr:PqqD family peptide modification chaperone [bacterium]